MTEPRYIDAILIKIVVNVIRKLHENHKKKPYTVRPLPEVLLIVTAESQQSPTNKIEYIMLNLIISKDFR